jgi:hypothetical protein
LKQVYLGSPSANFYLMICKSSSLRWVVIILS